MKNKASLLLMEQLIMILVFALAAAVCLKGFAYAAQTSLAICQQEEAVFLAQSAAEQIKAHHGAVEDTQYISGGTAQDPLWVCFYDDQLNSVPSEDNWHYRLEIEKTPGNISGLGQADVRVHTADSQQLVALTVAWQEE